MKFATRRTVLSSLVCGAMLASLSLVAPLAHASKDHPEIGFCIDDLRVERWSRDRDYFVAAAEKLGAKVSVQSADASEERQISQIENLISRGVDVIVIVPFNSKTLGNVVAEAKKAGIKVVSYDRLILDADVDAYISFDNEKVGELQAQGVYNAQPKGNYFLLGGAPTDNNAKMLREGQLKILKPAMDKGDIKVVGQQWVPEWSASTALRITEDALTANNNKIDAIVASNDGTAGGATGARRAMDSGHLRAAVLYADVCGKCPASPAVGRFHFGNGRRFCHDVQRAACRFARRQGGAGTGVGAIGDACFSTRVADVYLH